MLHAVLCCGDCLAHKHIVFHIDNEAVANALASLSIWSAPTMAVLRQLLSLACHLNFTFESSWLSSIENSLADAASRFSYSRLFVLAPYLNKQPSSKRLRLGGMTTTVNGRKPSCSIFGMGSHLVHDLPTAQASPVSSSTPTCTDSIMLTDPSSQHLNPPSCPGFPVSLATYNKRLSSAISPTFDPCTQTWTSHSWHAKRPSSSASSRALNIIMERKIANRSNPSPSPSYLTSYNTLNWAHPLTPPVAWHTLPSSAAVNLPLGARPGLIQQFTCPGTPSSSFSHLKIQPTSSSPSHPPKLTPSAKGFQSPLLPYPASHHVPSLLSNRCSKPFHVMAKPPFLKDPMVGYSVTISSLT